MDTSILHSRILEYKEKAKHHTSKEMILLFETWFLSIENYISDIEMDYFEAQIKITELRDIISHLCDIIIITGNSDKIYVAGLNDPSIKKAINLILKNKDRKNHNSITAISALLSIYPGIEFDNIQQVKNYTYGK